MSGALTHLITQNQPSVPNEINTAYEKVYSQVSYGLPLTPNPSQFQASWTIRRFGDLVGGLVIRLDWPDWLSVYSHWTPYHFVERIVISGGGAPLLTLSGKQLYLLHHFQPSSLRETCLTAAKHGMLLIPSPFVLPLVGAGFMNFNVLLVYNNHSVCDVLQEHWLKEGQDIFQQVNVPEDLVSLMRLYCEGLAKEEAEWSLLTDYQFLDLQQRDAVVQNDHAVHIRNYEYITLTLDPEHTQLNLNLRNLMSSLFFAVEKPDQPFEFYSTSEDPVKHVVLKLNNTARETLVDGKDWLISDKLLNRLPLPEEVGIYSMTFQNSKDPKSYSLEYVGQNVAEFCSLNVDKINDLTLEIQLHDWVPPGAKVCISTELLNILKTQQGMVGMAYAQ